MTAKKKLVLSFFSGNHSLPHFAAFCVSQVGSDVNRLLLIHLYEQWHKIPLNCTIFTTIQKQEIFVRK